jgi:hypothetical protein
MLRKKFLPVLFDCGICSDAVVMETESFQADASVVLSHWAKRACDATQQLLCRPALEYLCR